MEFRTIQQQIEQISQHMELLQQQQAELEISENALEELSKTTIQTEILAPIAEGIFFKTKLAEISPSIKAAQVFQPKPEAPKLLATEKRVVNTGTVFVASSSPGLVKRVLGWPGRGFSFIKRLFVEE